MISELGLGKVFIKDMETGDMTLLGEHITIEPSCEVMLEDSAVRLMINTEPITFTAKFKASARAFYYLLVYGNDLYLKFPKKLRRKKKWLRDF